ncbi:peptidoglycan-binding protein [Laspinema sp. D1]|uniref:Peptidoglycan-binding protein n=1 Tax=Laspinema palackyanum D2a TaxID=2953684 RepID=A0ABT2N0V0_9CYAN|nr:peptidoglycan-binding protein [Laspinema sp. D2a]
MDTLACIQAWLIWQEHNEQPEVPDIPLSSITGLVMLIVILTSPFNLRPAFAAELLARGSRGQQVVKLQDDLKEAGCFPPGVRSTGYYGKITKSAVTQLQKTHGLRVDGVVGEQTRSALDSGKICQSLATSGILKMGSRGKNVIEIQDQLNDLGFKVQKIDGIFGKETRGAVIRFQESNGLKPDGIVGSNTAKFLWKPRPSSPEAPLPETPSPETYEKALEESVRGDGIERISLENFQIIKSAIIDNNLDRHTQYEAAIILASQIYFYNFDKFSSGLYQQNNCLSYSCIDRREVYKTNIFKEQDSQTEEIIEKIVFDSMILLLNEATNEEQGLYRFMAVSAMPYLRQAPTQNIINIFKQELETGTILNTGFTDVNIERTVESFTLFTEYDNDFFTNQENQNILNSLKNSLKNSFKEASGYNHNQGYYNSYLLSSILILVGEEDYVTNEFNQPHLNWWIKLALANSIYKHIQNHNDKAHSLETIMSIYEENSNWFGFEACVVYNMGEESIKFLEEIKNKKPDSEEGINWLIDSINGEVRSSPCDSFMTGWGYIHKLFFGKR